MIRRMDKSSRMSGDFLLGRNPILGQRLNKHLKIVWTARNAYGDALFRNGFQSFSMEKIIHIHFSKIHRFEGSRRDSRDFLDSNKKILGLIDCLSLHFAKRVQLK